MIVTGMSGSGKHTAFKAFEDLGYFCVDNLPTSLIPRLIQMSKASGGKIRQLAIVVDIRLSGAGKRLMWNNKRGGLSEPQVFIADFKLPALFK